VLLSRAGAEHHTPFTSVDLQCAIVASMCLDRDIQNSTIALEARRYDRALFAASGSLAALSAITEAPPPDWPTRLAQAARAHSHGRLPDEESSYLAMMALLAIRDGDVDRAQYLNETVAPRSPICIALKRYNDIRIQGLPIETMNDEQHHLANIGQATDPTNERRSLNRTKMLEEIERRLD
jgi:hypothetical protein